MNDDQPGLLTRKAAASGHVSYSDPIIVHSGTQTHFEVMPQYIHHDSGPGELSLKLRYWKRKMGAVRVGYPAEFTLSENEAVQLCDVIAAAVALAHGGVGSQYLVTKIEKIDQGNIDSPDIDLAAVARSVATALGNPAVLNTLAADDEGRVLLAAVQSSVRLQELKSAVDELDNALESGEGSEQYYQGWCEKHSWAFGNAYAMRDEVRSISLGDQVDLLMKQTANGLRDIFELKRPDMRPLGYDKSHKCYYWSSEASRAIGQCHRYLDALHDFAQNGLRDNRDVVAYHPRAFIVQGRSKGWSEEQVRALQGLNSRLHGVQLMTYDQLLAQAEQLVSMLRTDVGQSE